MIHGFIDLPNYLNTARPIGCFADTTTLFSFSYHLDPLNEASERALEPLCRSEIPIFTNITVRAEFLEQHRRVLIPECLIDFHQDFQNMLPESIALKLQSHRTSYRRKLEEEKSVKFDPHQIKNFRLLLSQLTDRKENGWELLCRNYLDGKMGPLWETITKRLNITFLSIRSTDGNVHLNSIPSWTDAVSLMGRYGIASSDALILNMFLCSKIPMLLTADMEMAAVAEKEAKGHKKIFVPDALLG